MLVYAIYDLFVSELAIYSKDNYGVDHEEHEEHEGKAKNILNGYVVLKTFRTPRLFGVK